MTNAETVARVRGESWCVITTSEKGLNSKTHQSSGQEKYIAFALVYVSCVRCFLCNAMLFSLVSLSLSPYDMNESYYRLLTNNYNHEDIG